MHVIYLIEHSLTQVILRMSQGDLVDAVVPFMGESITDGTLATFLKSMSFQFDRV